MASISNNHGEFIYSLGDGTALDAHQRSSGTSFNETKLLQSKPRTESTGGILEKRQLDGVCYEKNADTRLETLFTLKNKKAPVVLVIGGNVLGLWTIEHVNERTSETLPNGKGRKVNFTVQLKEMANDA